MAGAALRFRVTFNGGTVWLPLGHIDEKAA